MSFFVVEIIDNVEERDSFWEKLLMWLLIFSTPFWTFWSFAYAIGFFHDSYTIWEPLHLLWLILSVAGALIILGAILDLIEEPTMFKWLLIIAWIISIPIAIYYLITGGFNNSDEIDNSLNVTKYVLINKLMFL
jgi:hypothetical protein